MKLLVLALILTSCWGQQGPPRQVTWDYSQWQPIIAPCPTCRQSRILEAKAARVSAIPVPIVKNDPAPQPEDTSSVVQLHPVFHTELPKITKPNPSKAPLVQSQQSRDVVSFPPRQNNVSFQPPRPLVASTKPRTLAIKFPPTRQSGFPTTPAVTTIGGNQQIRLVYLPEGSIQQLSSANAAKIIPPSQASNQNLEGIESIPPLLAPEAIQSIEFSDKQKRDHEGRIIPGGATSALPMSLITTLGHENDAREKLKLLEAALSSPIEQENGKLPRVFIAPSHVPPPPGYVKIPLVPQGKPEFQQDKEEPLPLTFLTPDSRNPPPGFVKFDLPSAVSRLSSGIPVVVPNSQVEPNSIFNNPRFSPTPGHIRPDASLNFQAQDVRTGKNIQNDLSAVQVISKGEPKSTVSPKSAAPSKQTTTKPSPQNSFIPAVRPIPQRAPTQFPQNNFQTQFFPPRQPSPLPQQFLPNPNQPRPFAPRPGQSAFPVFPQQPVFRPGQPFPQPSQFNSQSGQAFPRPGQSFSQGQQFLQQNPVTQRPGQQFQKNPVTQRPGQQFLQQNPVTQRPGQQFQKNPVTQRPGQQFFQQNPVTQRPDQQFLQQNPVTQRPDQQFFQQNPVTQRPNQQFLQQNPVTQRPDQQFFQTNQPFPRPGQFNQHFPQFDNSFPQQGQPLLQPGQTFPRIIQHFQQPNQPLSQPGQRPANAIANQSIFRSPNAPVKSDFPKINSPFSNQPQNPNLLTTTLQVSQPTTPLPPQSSPFPSSSLSPITTPQPFSNSVVQFSPRPQQITPFTSNQFPSSSSTPFIHSFSPRPIPVTQSSRFPERPFSFSTPPPLSLIPQSSPSPFSPTPTNLLTTRPIPVSRFTQTPQRPTFTSTQRPTFTSTQRPLFSTTPRPILTSPRPFSSPSPRPQLVTFAPLSPIETSSPRSPFQETFGFEDTSIESTTPFPQENLSHQTLEIHEPQNSFFQDPQAPLIPAFQEPERPQIPSGGGSLTVRIPSFQQPQTTTITRFPGPQSPRIPSFQRPSTLRTPVNDNFQEEPGRRQRLPIFPRFQKPRITTIAPEDDEQTLQPRPITTEFLIPTPVTPSPTTPSPPIPTTVKVTTFKPKFNFNLGNRRPSVSRKPRPTVEGKKDAGEKKSDVVTLFPPFSVARTLNPLRKENNEGEESSLPGQGVTQPPTGTFGRRLRPRTKSPVVRSGDDSSAASPRPSSPRSLGLVGNRARDLPDWLKTRRRVRGRFRGPVSSTTEDVRVVDSVLEEDIPLDVLDNNGFNGAESTLVVFSSPPENVVANPDNIQETEKLFEIVEEIEEQEEQFEDVEKIIVDKEQAVRYVSEAAEEDVIRQLEIITSAEENYSRSESSSASTDVLPEPHDPVESFEDYSYESEALPEPEPELPEPEPEPLNKYVAEYNKYEDDTEDTSETYSTHDQPHRQPPSFPNPQLSQHATIHTSAHSHPLDKFPAFPFVENSKKNPVETVVDYLVDEVDDATKRYVGNESSDESELVVNLPRDKETDEQKLNDTEVDIENDYESVTKIANFSYEDISSERNLETHQLGGEGEEDADGEMDGESQEHREDFYQEYRKESPEILSFFPNDHFTALSPGQLQEYDHYEYDSYVDEDYTEVDQNFGGSSAQLVYAVPVTEYYPEETTLIQANIQITDEENIRYDEIEDIAPTTEEAIPMTTEDFGLGFEKDYVITELPLIEEEDPGTESWFLGYNEVTPDYDVTTLIPEEEVPTSTPFDSSNSLVSTTTTTTAAPNTTTPVTVTTTTSSTTTSSTTTARPASIRPLYARLQSAGKKAAEITDKKIARDPKILGQSTVTEIRSSDPIICFRDNQCVRARGQRRRSSSYNP